MKISFFTLGCKVNQYDTQFLIGEFASYGFEIAPPGDKADVYVLNSCTVTSEGDKKCRQLLRKLRRDNPGAIIALTGCLPQAYPEMSSLMPQADVITGSSNRAELVRAVADRIAGGERIIRITPHQPSESFERMSLCSFTEHTRAFIKIQDGCDSYCSYCVIPSARGPVRSKSLADLERELLRLHENGYREAVLAGINLAAFGRDTGARLTDAAALACSIFGRVRLGSLEPDLLTPDDIGALAALDGLCPQFHLSLQSGCDDTLRRMNRRYGTSEYTALVNRLRNSFTNASITTDIMVGFPGESDDEFRRSLDFVEKTGFAKAHVFPYSARGSTPAALMDKQIEKNVKTARAKEMTELTQRLRLDFLKTQTGVTSEVLFEASADNGVSHGYTPNYTPVSVNASDGLCGYILPVTICGVDGDGCTGILQSPG